MSNQQVLNVRSNIFKTYILFVSFLLTSGYQLSASAAEQEFNSTKERVQLVELYTSEGCSSCPPADRWLSSLIDHKDLWTKVVPIAFHVDYWDYIGWKDPFASPRHTQRQYQFKNQGLSNSVYTPEVIRNGYELRDWYQTSAYTPTKGQDIGELKVKLKNGIANISFIPTPDTDAPLEANMALLGIDLATTVKAGENRGKTLKHNFVALNWQNQTANSEDNKYQWSLPLQNNSKHQAKAIAIWVSVQNDPRPIQAVGGLLR